MTHSNKTKVCWGCGRVFPATNAHFHKNRTRVDGLRGNCTSCENKRSRIRRQSAVGREQDSQPLRKLRKNLTTRMRRSVENVNGRVEWLTVVPWTFEQLVTRLESQFDSKMTWDNYGRWHLDHKLPVYGFDIPTKDSEGFQQCWALSNLQPLWGFQNQVKGKSRFANRYFGDEVPEWEKGEIRKTEVKRLREEDKIPF